MEYNGYPLLCYWDGEIVEANGVVTYRGGNQCFVLANSNMSYDELVEAIYKGISVEGGMMKLRVKMKYPCAGCFKVIALDSDGALSALWASVRHSKFPSMDIYIEMSPIEASSQFASIPSSFPISDSFTRMLTDDQFFLENFASPSHRLSPQIRFDDHSQFVSINTNNVDEAIYGDIEGDEAERELVLNALNDDTDNDEDLVGSQAPITEFKKLDAIDETHVNSWRTWSKVIPYEANEEFKVGQQFPNKSALTQVVTQYHLTKSQFYKLAESKPHTVTYKCSRRPKACGWNLRATQKYDFSEAFTIVTYKGPHETSCVADTIPIDHYNLNCNFVGRAIKNIVVADWSIKVRVIIQIIKERFNYTISYGKAWNAKQRAIEEIFGNWEKSYEKLPHFMQAMKEANPGTIITHC